MHVAMIMDGNGRWAQAQGRPRLEGHRAGADTVRRMVEAAPRLGVSTLTLYAFSSDNWKRPAAEVNGLLRLLDRYLREETERLRKEGVRIDFIGRRDRLPAALRERIEASEHATRHARRLRLRIALDYSGREAIRRGEIGPDVDLLIRTGGEQRLSDFLLWEAAYAELWFTRRPWPEFTAQDLEQALDDFRSRERRFGQVPAA
ncbi:MAG: polyprenyl diphosphate synthase [Bryobacter sp.]|nr:polyprenyl diphosphate synthase [Bryobacter sp.]